MSLEMTRNRRWRILMIVAVASASIGLAQDRPFLQNDDTILRFIDNAIDQGLPSDLMDDLYLISINRSDILLPQLVERLQNRDRQDVLVPKTRNGVLDLVAYSANERSLDVLLTPVRRPARTHAISSVRYFSTQTGDETLSH